MPARRPESEKVFSPIPTEAETDSAPERFAEVPYLRTAVPLVAVPPREITESVAEAVWKETSPTPSSTNGAANAVIS